MPAASRSVVGTGYRPIFKSRFRQDRGCIRIIEAIMQMTFLIPTGSKYALHPGFIGPFWGNTAVTNDTTYVCAFM